MVEQGQELIVGWSQDLQTKIEMPFVVGWHWMQTLHSWAD